MLKNFQCSTYSFRGHEDLFYLFFFTMQGTFLFWDSFREKMVLHWFIIDYLEPFWTKKIGLSNSKKNNTTFGF